MAHNDKPTKKVHIPVFSLDHIPLLMGNDLHLSGRETQLLQIIQDLAVEVITLRSMMLENRQAIKEIKNEP